MDLKLKRDHGHPGAAAAITRCALHGSNVARAGETGTAASGGGADQGGRGDGAAVIQNPSHKPLPKYGSSLSSKIAPVFYVKFCPCFLRQKCGRNPDAWNKAVEHQTAAQDSTESNRFKL